MKQKKNSSYSVFYNLNHPTTTMKQTDVNFTNVHIKNFFEMYMKLDYFYFSDFDLDSKVTEILKYILFLSSEKYGQGSSIN